jgi:hypothetical protein
VRPAVWLRVAAVLGLIQAVLHTVGGVFGSQEPGPQTVAMTAMRVNTFPLFGHLRSFWIFYRGFGLAITVSMVTEAAVLWLLAGLVASVGERLRPVLLVFALGYLASATVAWFHFFFPPVIMQIVIAACVLRAAVRLEREPVARPA